MVSSKKNPSTTLTAKEAWKAARRQASIENRAEDVLECVREEEA